MNNEHLFINPKTSEIAYVKLNIDIMQIRVTRIWPGVTESERTFPWNNDLAELVYIALKNPMESTILFDYFDDLFSDRKNRRSHFDEGEQRRKR